MKKYFLTFHVKKKKEFYPEILKRCLESSYFLDKLDTTWFVITYKINVISKIKTPLLYLLNKVTFLIAP